MNESKKELEFNGIQAAEFLVESGDSALDRYIELSRQEVLIKAEKETLKTYAMDERASHGPDILTLHGCKISISNTGDRLQYAKDPVIADLMIAIKNREKDVKIATKSEGTFFDNDGVEVEAVPVKYGAEVLKIQF